MYIFRGECKGQCTEFPARYDNLSDNHQFHFNFENIFHNTVKHGLLDRRSQPSSAHLKLLRGLVGLNSVCGSEVTTKTATTTSTTATRTSTATTTISSTSYTATTSRTATLTSTTASTSTTGNEDKVVRSSLWLSVR